MEYETTRHGDSTSATWRRAERAWKEHGRPNRMASGFVDGREVWRVLPDTPQQRRRRVQKLASVVEQRHNASRRARDLRVRELAILLNP